MSNKQSQPTVRGAAPSHRRRHTAAHLRDPLAGGRRRPRPFHRSGAPAGHPAHPAQSRLPGRRPNEIPASLGMAGALRHLGLSSLVRPGHRESRDPRGARIVDASGLPPSHGPVGDRPGRSQLCESVTSSDRAGGTAHHFPGTAHSTIRDSTHGSPESPVHARCVGRPDREAG